MHQLIPFSIIIATILIAIGAVKFFRYQTARKGLRSLFTQKRERFPGQSLLTRLDELNEEISIQAATLLAVPIAIYAGYISNLYFGNRPFHRIEAIMAAVLAIVFLGHTLFKLRGFLQERRNIRLGYEGEVIVGQALNRRMLEGYRVFHDFPAEKFNIDHVLVGKKGVFAIETKTRSKRTTSDRQQDATVEYDGRALHFPNGTDIDMIEQAKRQSKWLGTWLSQAVGEDISVRAIVALPGWFVKRTSSKGIPIVNPKQFDSLFAHIQPRPLTTEMITRIAHQLDQKCRDIEPQGYDQK